MRDRDDRPEPSLPARDEDVGGDAVCWAPRVCPDCGLFVPVEPPTRCPRCGGLVGID